jgi:hypothetical protein
MAWHGIKDLGRLSISRAKLSNGTWCELFSCRVDDFNLDPDLFLSLSLSLLANPHRLLLL